MVQGERERGERRGEEPPPPDNRRCSLPRRCSLHPSSPLAPMHAPTAAMAYARACGHLKRPGLEGAYSPSSGRRITSWRTLRATALLCVVALLLQLGLVLAAADSSTLAKHAGGPLKATTPMHVVASEAWTATQAQEWTAWRAAQMDANKTAQPRKPTYTYTCYKDDNVIIYTSSQDTCACSAQNVDAYARLRRAATNYAGLRRTGTTDKKTGVESSACLVDIACDDKNKKHAVIRGCAVHDKKADVVLRTKVPQSSSNPVLPIAVDFFTYDTQRRQAELFGAPSSSSQLRAKCVYKASSSSDPNLEYGIWQVTLTSQTIAFNEIIAGALGTTMATFSSRLGTQLVSSTQAIKSFGAKLSVRRSIVAAAIGYEKDKAEDVHVTAQVDASGRLNAYDERRVFGPDTAVTRLRAGAASTERFYAVDDDVCGGGNSQTPDVSAYVMASNFTAKGTTKLACSGSTKPPWNLNTAQVDMKMDALTMPLSLFESGCLSESNFATLERVKLKYERVMETPSIEASYGASHGIVHVAGKLQGRAPYVNFEAILKLGGGSTGASFIQPSLDSNGNAPLRKLLRISDGTFVQTILSALPIRSDSVADESLSFVVTGNTNVNLQGTMTRNNGGSFKSSVVFDEGSCELVSTMSGEWVTPGGIKAIFDITKPCRPDSSSSDVSLTFANPLVWAPSLSQTWSAKTSVGCSGDASVKQLAVTADAPQESIDVSIAAPEAAGQLTIKGAKMFASLASGRSTEIHALSSWASQHAADGEISGSFETTFAHHTDAASAPAAYLVSPDHNGDSQNAIEFVKNAFHLVGVSADMENAFNGTGPVVGIYDMLSYARLSSRASNACMLDSKTELRSKPSVSVTCLGQLSSSSQPKGLNAEQVKRLQAARAHVVADFVHTEAGIKAAPSRRMVGIAASRKSASIVLEPIDRELAALVEHELSLESSAVVMVGKRGTYRNLLPSADELRDELHENGPVVGAKTRFAQRLDGTATKLYRAGLYFIARVDRSKGMWKKFHEQNAGLALYTALFGRSGNHTRPSVMELDGAFDGTRKRLQLDTPLRGDLEWPETGIVLRADGGSVSELITTDGKSHQYLLNGRFNVELPRTYPIKLHSISRDTPNAVVWRAKGSLQITADDATGKLSAGGLLTFRTITLGSDPISLSLSRYVRFWQGTVGMSTNFEKPYVKCLGYAVKASWGKAERDEAESREDFYKHEVKLHFHVAKNKEAARVVDAISIEAHFKVIDGFQMMQPFVDIANVPSYTDANARLLNATTFYDAVVTINEDPAAINTGRISDGCLRPPKRKSSISFSSMDLGNAIWLRSFDRSNIVLEMDLSNSGPGMLSGSPSQSNGNAVVATGKFFMNIAYIGAFRLGSQNEIHRVHHKTGRLFKEGGKSDPAAFDDPSKVGTQDLASQLKTQNVQAEIILRTEMGNIDAVDLHIDASIAALGVSWMAKIHHVSAVNGILAMKDGLGLDVPKDFETRTYGFMIDLEFHPGENAVVNAKVLTSSHDVHSQDMKSFFAMKLDNEGANEGSASALKAYSSYIDVEVTKYHKRVASQIEEGLSSDAMASQQSLCRSHPLNFGACIVAALNVASPGSVSASRRALLATSNAGEMVSALAKAAKVLKSKTSAAASLEKIQITAAKPTPMNPYVSLVIKLNDAKSLLTHCLAVADPSSCEARQDEVDRLTNETYAMSNTVWLEGVYDSGIEGLVTAEVKGSVAGGVKKAFNVEVNEVYPATFAKAVFTAYLDDVHASVAELIATEIQGSYRTAKQASEETCTDPVFVDTNYPLKACSKFPPPASVADARGAWGGWGDAAGLLDLARAMQREGMHANGLKEPLTSFADSETIAHDSFSVSTVVASVALDSSEISEEQRKVAAQISTDLSTRAGEATEGTMNVSMSMHGLNDDGVVVVGGKLANSKVQLQAYVSSDFTLGMLPAVVSALASPVAMANRTFVDADGGYFLAEPWGVSARREPGMVVDTSPAHLADTARHAISVASRDILNKSLADCGPVDATAEKDATTRRRALLSAGGGSSASAAWRLSGLAWTGLFGICALALHRTAGNAAHGGAAAYYRRMYGLAVLMMLALAANFVPARAQSASDVIQWAGSAIDLGVELAQEGITDQEISFTVPELGAGGLSTSEIALTGTITWRPGSNSDFSDATYDITASAGEAFTVAYDGLFNLEVSDLSVTVSKASDAAKGSWSFTGTIGGISLELSAGADGFESMSLDGAVSDSSDDGMTNLLSKFSNMFGESFELSSIKLDASDSDGDSNWALDIELGATLFGSEGSVTAKFLGSTFQSFTADVATESTSIKLSGAPFCSGGGDVEGEVSVSIPSTESKITVAAIASAVCDGQTVTSLKIDGTSSIDLPALSIDPVSTTEVTLQGTVEYVLDRSDPSASSISIEATTEDAFTVTYDTDFLNMEISSLSMTYTNQPKSAFTFEGKAGGIALSLAIEDGALKTLSLNGELEEDGEEGMTNLLAKFSDMLGDSVSISSVQLDVSDEDGNGKYDIGVSFECSIWSSEATLAGTWDEGAFASFETTVSMGDAKIELSGAPFCTGGDDVQGKLTYTTDDETETKITASVAAECGANNKPTSLTIQGSTDGTVTIPMGSLALEIQSLEIKYVNSLGDDESSGSFSLAATVDPVTLKAKIASQDSSYQLTIGDSESSEPVDWAASVRSIGDSDNQLQSAIPPALTGDSMQLYYLDVTVKTSSEETTYALALKFELAGATVEGSIETDGSFSPTQASLSVKTETIRLTFGYESSGAEDDGGSTYDATFALLQELGGESAKVSAFDLEGSVTIDEGGNFDVSVSQGDDPITISVLGTDFVITGLSCTYASSSSQLTLKANVEDTFSIDVAATLPIKSDSSRRHLNQGDQGGSLQSVAFTTESIQFSDLASLGAMGSLVGKGIADIEGEITDLELSYDASTGDVEVSATITIMSFEADISATYGSSDNILKTFSIDMRLGDSIQLTAEGTSPCGEDGSGGTISGKIKMDDLPYGLGNLDLDCSATFTCKSGANGNRAIQSVAVVAEVNEGLDLTFDAFNVGLNTLRVEYDSADGQFSFTGGFGTDGATQVELRFNYSPGGEQSASDINLELEVKEDISFESLHNMLLGEDNARAATQSLSDDASGIGADVKASSIKPGSIIQLGMVNGVVKFAIVGLLRIYDMDVRLVIVGEDLTNADTRRFFVAVDIAADAGALPEAIRTIAEQSGGLQMSVMIANKEGTFTYPRPNLDEPNGDGARRLLADVEEEPDDPDGDDDSQEVVEMDDKFVLKITPGEANDPFKDLKADQVQPSEEAGSSSSPFNSDDFGSALYVTIGSISPLDFSVFVSINIEKQFGGGTACATETTLKNVRVGFRYQNNAPSLFLASNWKISMPECEDDAPVDGTEPTVLRLAGEIGISLPFTITGALMLDAGDDGWNNPFDLTESLTIYQVSVQFGFTPPTLTQFGISAQADLGELKGDVELYVQIVPTPQALFRSELENVDSGKLFAMMMGSSDGASFFADGDPSFIEAAKFSAYANTGAPRTLGDSGEEIPTGFGVATEGASLLWGLVTADELSLSVGTASQGVGGSVQVFANIDPIILFGGMLQITGREATSRPSLWQTIWDRRGDNGETYGPMSAAYGAGLWVVFEARYDYNVVRENVVRKHKYFVDDMPDGTKSEWWSINDRIKNGYISNMIAFGEDTWFVFGSKPPQMYPAQRSGQDGMLEFSLQQMIKGIDDPVPPRCGGPLGPKRFCALGYEIEERDKEKSSVISNVGFGDGRWLVWWDKEQTIDDYSYNYHSDINSFDNFLEELNESSAEKNHNRCGALAYGGTFWFYQTHNSARKVISMDGIVYESVRPPFIHTMKRSALELAGWLEDNAKNGYLADQIAYGNGKWVACMYKQMDDDPERRSDAKVHVTESLTSTTSYSNPILYVDVQASTNPSVIVCADGRLYFLGIEVLLTFYLTVNTGDANCRTILEEKGVELTEPTNNNVQIPEGGGVYFDGQISWGELKINVAFSANSYRIWESDAQIQFYLAVDAGDSSIITVVVKQLAESLGTMLQRFVDDIINFGRAFVESIQKQLKDAEDEVTRVQNEINEAINKAQQKLDDASDWAEQQWSYYQQYTNDCGFWDPAACAKAGFYATAGATADAAIVVAREFLNQARNAVDSLADTARGALRLAQDALNLANEALEMLRNALYEGISSTMNAINSAADALDAIISLNNLSVEACIGEGCEQAARLSVTVDLFRMGGATHELEIFELSIKALASSAMSAFGDSILSFVKSFIPENIRSALNLDRRRRSRRWQRRLLQSYENVDCLNATQVRECFPECCTDDSKSWATLEDSLLATETLSRGGAFTARLKRGSALSPEETTSAALDVFLSTRGTYVNTNGKAPIFSAAARKPKPRYGDIILAYEPGEVNDFAGNDIPTLLTPVLKSATYGLDSEGTAKVDLACKKCGGLPSNGLWRVHVSGVVYQDMPAVISALGSRKMQLQLRYEMLGRGYLSPTLVELAAGSAEAMLGRFDDENRPMVKALADRPAVAEVASYSEYTAEAVCRVDNSSASGGSNIITAITKKSGGNGLSDGAMAGIAIAMLIVGMVTVACIVAVIYKKKKAVKMRQKSGTYAEPGAAASHGVQMSSFKFEENTPDADTPLVEEATIAAASSSPLKRQVSMRDDPSFRRTGSSRGDIVTVAARRWLAVLGDTRVTGTVVDDAPPGANHVKVYFPGDGEHEGQLETVDVNDAKSDVSMLLKSC